MKTTFFNAKARRLKGTKNAPIFLRLCNVALLRYVFLLFVLASCIPARVPDNLDDTPGPPVQVSDQQYSGVDFSARYPAGWRVVTGEAQVPQSVIFVAPDEVSYIRLHVGKPAPDDAVPNLKSEVRTLTLANGVAVTAVLNAPPESFDTLMIDFEQVVAALESP